MFLFIFIYKFADWATCDLVLFKDSKVEQTMEAHAHSVEYNLIESLSFKLRPGASYVTDRKSVSYFPNVVINTAQHV